MSFGFNSNVRVGETVYHVQTEEHGTATRFIDTTVYTQGHVLHRRKTSIQDLLVGAQAGEVALEKLIEKQHREVIDELRSGKLKMVSAGPVRPARAAGAAPASPAAPAPSAIQVQLLNPASWLAAGTVNLQIEVLERGTRQPAAGAEVEVKLEGTRGPAQFAVRTDAAGHAAVSFPMPPLGPGGATLIVAAKSSAGQDEIRYQLRPKPRAPAP